MDFELDDEQLELQRVVRDLVERECPPSLPRAVAEGRDEGLTGTVALWETLVGMGLPVLTVPESQGGAGATPVELVLALEELGRGADPSPFLVTASQYVPVVREAFGDRAGALLEPVGTGGTGAVAFDAPDVRAESDGDGWRLSGAVSYVMDADRADQLAVAVPAGDDLGVVVVPTAAVTTARTQSFDATYHIVDVRLDGVAVPADRAVVGPEVAAAVARAREEAVLGIAAVTVGACQRILDLVLEHVTTRKQFGVPIGSFQAVKHMAVDMYVAIQRARALVQFGALAVAEDDDRRVMATSMAKAGAGDAQRIVARHGIQLFGGLGYTWENDLHLYVRRAKAGELLFGSSVEHRIVVAHETMARQVEAAAS